SLESELAKVRQEKESLTQQLLNTIKHKVVLSQELDAWQKGKQIVSFSFLFKVAYFMQQEVMVRTQGQEKIFFLL
ncbi:hypothetical protein XENOCAPTIV_001923, partial [Xenoophorus captivus]